jgi:hypothetical protein
LEDAIMALSIHALAGLHLRTRSRESVAPSAGVDFAALMDGQAPDRYRERAAPVSPPHLDPLQGLTTPHVDPLDNVRAPHVDLLETLLKPHVDPVDRFATTHIDPATGSLKPHIDPLENPRAPHVEPLDGPTMPHVDPPLEEDKTEDRYITAMREALMRFTSMSVLLRLGQSI